VSDNDMAKPEEDTDVRRRAAVEDNADEVEQVDRGTSWIR
jgi:hypothetical protein